MKLEFKLKNKPKSFRFHYPDPKGGKGDWSVLIYAGHHYQALEEFKTQCGEWIDPEVCPVKIEEQGRLGVVTTWKMDNVWNGLPEKV